MASSVAQKEMNVVPLAPRALSCPHSYDPTNEGKSNCVGTGGRSLFTADIWHLNLLVMNNHLWGTN